MTNTAPANELSLTQVDADLFKLEDIALRAKSLRSDVLPRMDQILRKCVELIREVYADDAFEYSCIIRSPNYMKASGEEEGKYGYMECRVGLEGERSDFSKGLENAEGPAPIALPVQLLIILNANSAAVMLVFGGQSPSPGSSARMMDFFVQHWSRISTMSMEMSWGIQLHTHVSGGAYLDHMEFLTREFLDEEDPVLQFGNWSTPLPIEGDTLSALVDDFVFLWPLYHSIIRISMGEEPDFLNKVAQLNRFIVARNAAARLLAVGGR